MRDSSQLIRSTLNKNTIQLEHGLNLNLERLGTDRWHTINKELPLELTVVFAVPFCDVENGPGDILMS